MKLFYLIFGQILNLMWSFSVVKFDLLDMFAFLWSLCQLFGLTVSSSFISALWPFSTLGWPYISAEDFKRFYPTTMLETGYVLLILNVSNDFIRLVKIKQCVPLSRI